MCPKAKQVRNHFISLFMCISQTSTGERVDNKWKAKLVIAPDENAVKYDDCYLLLSVGLYVKKRTEIYIRDAKCTNIKVDSRADETSNGGPTRLITNVHA